MNCQKIMKEMKRMEKKQKTKNKFMKITNQKSYAAHQMKQYINNERQIDAC